MDYYPQLFFSTVDYLQGVQTLNTDPSVLEGVFVAFLYLQKNKTKTNMDGYKTRGSTIMPVQTTDGFNQVVNVIPLQPPTLQGLEVSLSI